MLGADAAPKSRAQGLQDAVSHGLGDAVSAKHPRPRDCGVAADAAEGSADMSSGLVR